MFYITITLFTHCKNALWQRTLKKLRTLKIFLRSVREIFSHLDTSHDEILIRYKGIGIVFS